MFDARSLVLWAAIVFCSASLIKAIPVETVSKKTAATCEICGKTCDRIAEEAPKCTCQERLQSSENATSHEIRARSVPEDPLIQHHVFKRERRCVGMEFLGAENSLLPPESANKKLREDIEKRLAEIKSRVEAIRSLSFVGSKRAKTDDVKGSSTVADPGPAVDAEDTGAAQATVAAAADQALLEPIANTLQSAADKVLGGLD